MDLNNADISKAVDAKLIDTKLNGLKWITPQNSDDPYSELTSIKKVLEIIDFDKSNKTIITDYQFISVVLSLYDNSPNKVWYYRHVYPSKRNKYFVVYKKFFIKKLKRVKYKTFM